MCTNNNNASTHTSHKPTNMHVIASYNFRRGRPFILLPPPPPPFKSTYSTTFYNASAPAYIITEFHSIPCVCTLIHLLLNYLTRQVLCLVFQFASVFVLCLAADMSSFGVL